MNRSTKRIATVIGMGSLAVGGLSVSLAAGTWSASDNTGNGYAKAKSISFSVSDATASASADLYPGGPDGDVKVKITNDSAFPVNLSTVTLTFASATGCTTPALSAGSTTTAAAITALSDKQVAANDNEVFTLAGVVKMGDSSSNCQGAVLAIPAAVTVTN